MVRLELSNLLGGRMRIGHSSPSFALCGFWALCQLFQLIFVFLNLVRLKVVFSLCFSKI